ncbi:TPA: phage virion morphogenesis protein [Morganella morganii]|nr:phage virion morphogenesis protein [Morganella morganii]HAE76489.1 phage virion morphogenesis protein [Morganella sp. (in: enterobacteria)]QXO58480.1 phage virion morphogenesis protein [Morganella morganii]QXO60761.1 phage virion morphogenesis protein [Morganella morganii]QXO77444.1 phage virion morphogenesis protein [Morganella morganii]HCT7706607.1 phage virion morphogenesis protein [Morganella morganii]
MYSIKINTDGFEAALDKLVRGLENREPLMRRLAGMMADAVEENFAQEGRPKWMGWSPSTARRRRGGRILQLSGRLAGSIGSYSDNDSAVVGTNVKYARIHQEGGEIDIPARSQRAYYRMGKDGTVGNRFVRKSRSNYSEWHTLPAYKIKMPARPFLQLDDWEQYRMVLTIEDYLTRLTGE